MSEQVSTNPADKAASKSAGKSTVTATEGHREFGKLLRRVYNSDEPLVVERDGFPVAVMMSYEAYRKLTRSKAEERLEQLGRAVGREIEAQGLTEEELFAELKETRREIFKETYGDPEQWRT